MDDFAVELKPDILKKAHELNVKSEDIEEQFIRGGGSGGQKINKTSSAVRLKHTPSGIEVKVQKHRERSKNRMSAYKLLINKIEEVVKGEESEKAKKIHKLKKQKAKRSKRAKEKLLEIKESRKKVNHTKLLVLALVITFSGCSMFNQPEVEESVEDALRKIAENIEPNTTEEKTEEIIEKSFVSPMTNPRARITKIPFGTKVPEESPVPTDRFSGYHSGTDFEILEGELEIDVPVFAICEGEFYIKRMAQGYGGFAAQYCLLEDQPIVVIYGHMNLDSVEYEMGDILQQGDVVGLLGDHKSEQTDGERKHLHLGIRKGSETDIRGYVPSIEGLEDFINVEELLFP